MKHHLYEDELNEWGKVVTRPYLEKSIEDTVEDLAKLDANGNVLDGNGNIVSAPQWELF